MVVMHRVIVVKLFDMDPALCNTASQLLTFISLQFAVLAKRHVAANNLLHSWYTFTHRLIAFVICMLAHLARKLSWALWVCMNVAIWPRLRPRRACPSRRVP